MNTFLLDFSFIWASALALQWSSSLDKDLQWRSVDWNKDGKPDSSKDPWIISTRSWSTQGIGGFVSSELKNGIKSRPSATTSLRQNKADLSGIKWAHAVNSKIQLNNSIRGKAMIIEGDVSMGFIESRGEIALPIMAHPPSKISDLSLTEFVDTVLHSKTSKGMKFDFKELEVVEPSLKMIKARANEITGSLWLNADIVQGPVNDTTIPVDAAQFLKLVKQYFPDAILSVGWTTRFGPQLALPLQIINDGSYTMDHVIKMRDVLKAAEIRQQITFPIRAGLSTSPESQASILWLLEQFDNSSLTIWSADYDMVDVPGLMKLVNHIGKENIYIDVPSGLNCEIQHFDEYPIH
ncbi:protein FAM151B-like [Daphnia carinata]|uniref:protein FAM151B-like n=1 Tax=Daphnia carinata TaxID=120202 RepID=UPI00257DC798|nr:protein FAM151B-like [Daphnia carinata]